MRLLEYFCRVGFCLGVGKEGASRTDFWDRRAVVVKPSGSWEGNDGVWSTFEIGVGTPAQTVRILPASARYGTAIAYNVAEGIGDDVEGGDDTFGSSRDGTFDTEKSLSWEPQKRLRINKPRGNGEWRQGLDSIRFAPNATISSMTVAAIHDSVQSVGLLGLKSLPTHSSLYDPLTASVSNALYYQGVTQSPTWSYTAGAYYRGPNALGSLIFGGYEFGRCTPNDVGFHTSKDTPRELMVSITSITTKYSGKEITLLDRPISANIDSGIVEIVLPLSICERFRETFQLSYDSAKDVYFIDQATHVTHLISNPTITFTLTPFPTGRNINITLPYLAFAQTLRTSTDESKLYFPIRATSDPESYTLGRVFLQEAYLIVNADMFTVSQVRYPNVPPRIITLPSFPPPTPKASWKLWPRALGSKRRHRGRPSGGAIAGIVIAVVGASVSMAVVIWIIVRRRARVMKRMSTAVLPDTERGEVGGTDVEMSQKSTTQTTEHATERDNLMPVNPPQLPESILTSAMIEYPRMAELPASTTSELNTSSLITNDARTELPSHESMVEKPTLNTQMDRVKTEDKELNSASSTDSPGTKLGRRKSRFSEELFD